MLVDSFGREITYLRLSVTDRCNLRCSYCMGEDVVFVPRSEILHLEEMARLCRVFVDLGIRTIRLTGGEPLTRPNILSLVERLGEFVHAGKLDELTLTTNGTRLEALSRPLHALGINRINVSLDTLDPKIFQRITGHDGLAKVIAGIAAAQEAGIAVRINTVVLGGVNDHEIDRLLAWCGNNACDISLIESMPIGGMASRAPAEFLSLDTVRQRLEERWTLNACERKTAGPSRYVTVAETGRRLGFITPLSHGFCGSCNRVRLTCTGRLHLCLAHETGADLRSPLRESEDDNLVKAAIHAALEQKPAAHHFATQAVMRASETMMWRLGG